MHHKYIIFIFFIIDLSFCYNSIGVEYLYIPSITHNYSGIDTNYNSIYYSQSFYNIFEIGLYYNHSLLNNIEFEISTGFFNKNISNSYKTLLINNIQDVLFQKVNNIFYGIDLGIFYKVFNIDNIDLLIGPKIGYAFIWNSYYINNNYSNFWYDYSFSFYGSSPYLKICCYSNIFIIKHMGLKIGTDFIYSKTIFNNSFKSISFPLSHNNSSNLSVYIKGANNCIVNQFISKIGLFYYF